LAYASSAVFAIAPIQDVMGLGTEDRMNQPGIPMGYWKFRYTADMLTAEQAGKLAYLCRIFNRLPVDTAK
jgi:4-alpha-glucanotransferase